MSKLWTGILSGVLAGAAGATAKNAVTYLDQLVRADPPPSSPDGSATEAAAAVAAKAGHAVGDERASALGGLGGIGVGLGVGALSGAVRGENLTPNPVLAAVVTGLAAMAAGDGVAAATGAEKSRSTGHLARDVVSHLAYGAVTGWTLHRLLDPRTPAIARFDPRR